MLASFPPSQPQTPQYYGNQHYQPQDSFDQAASPPSSTLPFQHTSTFSSYPLSSHQDDSLVSHRPQYFNLTSSTGGANKSSPAQATASIEGYSLMNNAPLQLQAPPVRVQRSSPTPQTSRRPSRDSSSPHPSMLSEGNVQQSPWLSPAGSMRSSGHGIFCQPTAEPERKTHQRIPSDSSVGSAGPASPFDVGASHPQIAQSDSGIDSCWDSLSLSGEHSAGAKTHTSTSPNSFLAPAFQNYNPATEDSASNLEAKIAMIQALKEQQRIAREEDSPAPSFSTPGGPATPKTMYGEDYADGSTAAPNGEDDKPLILHWLDDDSSFDAPAEFRSTVPTLDRTMSQIYGDELYNPCAFDASIPEERCRPAAANGQNNQLLSPYRTVFSERIQAANNDHIRARSNSPANGSDRGHSPYRPGFGSPSSPSYRIGSAAQVREQQKAEADAEALRNAQSPHSDAMTTPHTISPKDAVLDYVPTEEDMKMPLFPPADSGLQFSASRPSQGQQTPSMMDEDESLTEASYGSMTTRRRQSSSGFSTSSGPSMQPLNGFAFAPPSVAGGIQVPQQYPFVPQQRRQMNSLQQSEQTPEFPAHLTSMESSVSDAALPDSSAESRSRRPSHTSAESGTYTCTYHGCTLRFETPAKLQKHKREGHRQGTPAHLHASSAASSIATDENADDSSAAAAALLRNSQAGPHKCERFNPSTGKPCNTIFSRPYDLTRHEDTIHNVRKQKVRCQLCTEEKSFSRNDALTRHMRVVHPEVDFGGRSRRKHLL